MGDGRGGNGRAPVDTDAPVDAPADASADAVGKAEAPKGAKSGRSASQARPAAPSQAKAAKEKRSWLSTGSNCVVGAILLYSAWAAQTFRAILWPKFDDMDPRTHKYVPKHGNIFKEGDTVRAKLWVDNQAFPSKAPLAEFEFRYQWEGFATVSHSVNASISEDQLRKGQNLQLSAEVLHAASGRKARARGGLVKSSSPGDVREKYHLPTGRSCPAPPQPHFGKPKKGVQNIARGIPKMEVRLVFDTMAYPYWYYREPYVPELYVDEFWMTDDQLVRLNATGRNMWASEVHFNLMSAPRWRFQRHMENALEQQAQLFGADSEEMLQIRDLFANTSPWLLVTTLVVSVLHCIFEFLAFKNDVEFFQGVDADTLNKYVSVQSIVVGILFQIVLLLYLWDESANMLVLATSVVSIAVDVWKVQRAMRVEWVRLFGVLPVPRLVAKTTKEKRDNFDTQAMQWLSLGLSPFVLGYAVYTLCYDCHRGWYAYFLFVSSSCVYSLGFVLMTPQVFMNYKNKSVAYLPWRKFVYRALNTFIDDLFAFIVRMPTMHRLSCFRDDLVFFVYLYQRQIYKVDKTRTYDEDGNSVSVPEPGKKDN